MVEYLIGKGANINATTANGDTPLFYAAFNGNFKQSESDAINCIDAFFGTIRFEYHPQEPIGTIYFRSRKQRRFADKKWAEC